MGPRGSLESCRQICISKDQMRMRRSWIPRNPPQPGATRMGNHPEMSMIFTNHTDMLDNYASPGKKIVKYILGSDDLGLKGVNWPKSCGFHVDDFIPYYITSKDMVIFPRHGKIQFLGRFVGLIPPLIPNDHSIFAAFRHSIDHWYITTISCRFIDINTYDQLLMLYA